MLTGFALGVLFVLVLALMGNREDDRRRIEALEQAVGTRDAADSAPSSRPWGAQTWPAESDRPH